MMPVYRSDLHVHTCLSPCAENEMRPPAILSAAAERGLQIIAICDHNSAANVTACSEAAADGPVTVVAGMEVTTREEVHVVALFESLADAMDMQALVKAHLEGENEPEYFGDQLIVDRRGQTVGRCSRLLIGATRLSIREVVDAIHARSGCAVAAHVDRERFSVISQLGFVPPRLPLDGLEHSWRVERKTAKARYGGKGRWEMIASSDAHRLPEVGRCSTTLELERPTVGEIVMALHRAGGRRVLDCCGET